MRTRVVLFAAVGTSGLGLLGFPLGLEFTRSWSALPATHEAGLIPLVPKILAAIQASPLLSHISVVMGILVISVCLALLKMGACRMLNAPDTDAFEPPRHDV